MDKKLRDVIHKYVPEFNRETGLGLATSELDKIEDYIARAFQCAFPPGNEYGVKYHEYRRCTSKEMFSEISKMRHKRRSFDLAKSTVYMTEYYLSINNEALAPIRLLLPYCERGGLYTARGVTNALSPVLVDKGLSKDNERLFIWLNKKKLNFERVPFNIVVNGNELMMQIVTSAAYKLDAKAKARQLPAAYRNTASSGILHYAFAKYGFEETLKKYCNVGEIKIGTTELLHANLDPNEWFIFEGVKRNPPKNVKVHTDLVVAVKQDRYKDDRLMRQRLFDFMTLFFYVAWFFPEELTADNVNSPYIWQLLMGHVIFKSGEPAPRLLGYIEGHLRSIEDYIDALSIPRLRAGGIGAEDIYSFFVEVNDKITGLVATDDSSGMVGKSLTILEYVAEPIVNKINTLIYKIKAAKNPMTAADLDKEVVRVLKYDTILGLAKDAGFSSVARFSGDNLLFNVTNIIVPQSEAVKRKKNKSGKVKINTNVAHADAIYFGSMTAMPKAMPTMRNRLNPTAVIDEHGSIVLSDEELARRDYVQEVLYK